MSKTVNEVTKEKWLVETFPEWGTYLNEEIETEVVDPGTLLCGGWAVREFG